MLKPDRNEINNNFGEVSEFFVTRIQYRGPFERSVLPIASIIIKLSESSSCEFLSGVVDL